MERREFKKGPRREGGPGGPRGPRGERDKRRRKKICYFCANKTLPDYKAADFIKKFTTERGKIQTQRSSGCCAKHQRALAKQIKRARQIGLLAYTAE